MAAPRPAGLLLAVVISLSLAGCGGRRAATAPPAAEVPPPQATDPAAPPSTAPTSPGAVTAPWDTAARSRAARRAHVYPKGESALGRKLVASLPDPGGLAPSEGGPPPAPAPGATTPGTADCWQAQLLTTSDAARADRARNEAEALLGVPVAVVSREGVHRVRAGGCLDAEAASGLAARARAERWPEAFRVRGGS